MSNLKFVTGYSQALTSLYADVGKGNCICYDIDTFPGSGLSGFYPPTYLSKCSSVSVAISGDANQRDWLAVVPFRVDAAKSGKKFYDQDPFIISFDADSGTPAETGIVAYHQDYSGRTTPISGYDHLSKPETIAALRLELTTGKYPVSEAAPEVITALQHMATVFQIELE